MTSPDGTKAKCQHIAVTSTFKGTADEICFVVSSSLDDSEPTSLALCLRPHCFCGIGVLPVGPIAVICKITSPSFAHA